MLQQVRQAYLFAIEWAKDAAQEMLETLKRIKKRSNIITKLVLAASMPHQFGYILVLELPFMDWNSVTGVVEGVGMLLIAVAFPVGCDLLILNCIETVGAKAASMTSRKWALALMVGPVLGSAYVNFDAPGPGLTKYLAGAMILLIPASQALRFIVPDFAKIDAMETSVVASVAPVPEPKVEMKKGPSKRDKAMRILADNPGTSPTELARRIKSHYNYAHALKAEFDKQRLRELEPEMA